MNSNLKPAALRLGVHPLFGWPAMDNPARPLRKKPPGRILRAEAGALPVAEAESIDVGILDVGSLVVGSLVVGSLAQHLGYALKRAQLRVFDDFIDAVAPLNLSPAQFSVLILLEANPGRNQTEIAATLGILRPNFVKLLDGMEARGLCKRTRSVDDRRSHVLVLTDKGRNTLTKATRLVSAKHEKKLAALLSESERTQLMAMLERVARAL